MAGSTKFILGVPPWWIPLALCILVIPTNCSAEIDRSRYKYLPNIIKPIQYEIFLEPKIEKAVYEGSVEISFELLKEARSIGIHANMLRIKADKFSLAYRNGTKIDHILLFEENLEVLSIHPPLPIQPGLYTLNLTYRGTMSDCPNSGFHRWSYTDDETNEQRWLAAIRLKPSLASSVFPCWDDLSLKTHIKLTVKYPSNYQVLSNLASLDSKHMDDENIRQTTFYSTFPTFLHNLVLIMHDLPVVTDDTGVVNIIGQPEVLRFKQFLLDYTPVYLRKFSDFFSKMENMQEINYIFAPNYSCEPFEYWGGIMSREDSFTYDESEDDIFQQRLAHYNISLALIRQWLDISVTQKERRDVFWSLFKGVIEYFSMYIVDKVTDEWQAVDFLVVDRLRTLSRESLAVLKNAKVPDNIIVPSSYDETLFNREAILVRQMSHILSESVFNYRISNFVYKYECGEASGSDLFDELNTIWSPRISKSYKALSMQDVLSGCFKTTDRPLLNVTYEKSGKLVVSREPEVHNDRVTVFKEQQWVALNYALKSWPHFNETFPTHWLPANETKIVIDVSLKDDDCFIFNIQRVGDYRVTYDFDNYECIILHLQGGDFAWIHPLNRADLLETAHYLVLRGKLHPNIFVNLMNYLRREKDYRVWLVAFDLLPLYAKLINQTSDDISQHLQNLMRSLTYDVGFQDRSTDSYLKKFTRIYFRYYSCLYNNPECKNSAKNALSNYLSEYGASSIVKLTDVQKKWIFCDGLSGANEELWNKVDTLFHITNDIDIGKYIVCVKNRKLFMNTLYYVKNQYKLYASDIENATRHVVERFNPEYKELFEEIVKKEV